MAQSRTVKYVFKPEDLPKDSGDRRDALERISEFLKGEIKAYCADQNSPVAGHGRFPKLTKEYKKFKQSEGEPGIPNLVLSGDMLDALQVKPRNKDILIQLSGKQGAKADGHCNQSGDSKLPLRRFIPNEDEVFKREILAGVKNILDYYTAKPTLEMTKTEKGVLISGILVPE